MEDKDFDTKENTQNSDTGLQLGDVEQETLKTDTVDGFWKKSKTSKELKIAETNQSSER